MRKRVQSLRHPAENWELYKRPDDDDEGILDLAADIRTRGLQDDLIVTRDGYVVSGNRRLKALCRNGQKFARCKVLPIRWSDLTRDDRFAMLRSNNLQRSKSAAEQVRETLIDFDPTHAAGNLRRGHERSLNGYRRIDVSAPLAIEGNSRRAEISAQKSEHRRFILRVVNDLREYWALSGRGIHYALLNHRFFRNTRLRTSYANDDASYAATCNLITRMLLNGDLPWEAIDDQTRPLKEHRAFGDVRHFARQEAERLFGGYWRDLQQSQPNFVAVVVEKNTVYSMAKRVTDKYQLPTMSGRGFCSITPWKRLHDCYLASGKQRLILIVLSDYDCEGELIPHVAGRTLRDDFGVDDLHVIKAGVTRQQVEKYRLPAQNFAKDKSPNRDWFVNRNGGDESVYELEALAPAEMLKDLECVVRNVLDLQLFNIELQREREDLEYLQKARRDVAQALKKFKDR